MRHTHKKIYLYLDEELVQKAEEILDGIGGLQVGVTIFLNRLVKEKSIMFLFNESKAFDNIRNTKKGEDIMNTTDYKYNDTFISKTKKSITNEMRDCVWSLINKLERKADRSTVTQSQKILPINRE